MSFSSVSAYNLDPHHWQQEHNHHNQIIQEISTNYTTATATNPTLMIPTQPTQNHVTAGSSGPNSSRPITVSERARLANIPIPEAALKCPRCESTNTKFCYFNNYSLTQPRHFCKTCRRYWTRGGALRNVPVGGGCRRNRKPSSSKSTSSKLQTSSSTANNSTKMLPSLGFVSPLGQVLSNVDDTDHHRFANDVNLTTMMMTNGFGEMNSVYGSTNNVVDPWQLQFMGGLDPMVNGYLTGGDQVTMKASKQISRSVLNHDQLAGSVKMEEISSNYHDIISRQLMMMGSGGLINDHQWNMNSTGANGCWNNEISCFSSSSTSSAL